MNDALSTIKKERFGSKFSIVDAMPDISVASEFTAQQ
jgi:hypothetical protein